MNHFYLTPYQLERRAKAQLWHYHLAPSIEQDYFAQIVEGHIGYLPANFFKLKPLVYALGKASNFGSNVFERGERYGTIGSDRQK